MVNKPLIRPYFWGGYVRGGRLTSHDIWWLEIITLSNEHIIFLLHPMSQLAWLINRNPISKLVSNRLYIYI